jgi:hypothetical protein
MESDFVTTLRRVVDLVKQASISYHITGGLASTYYGEPRLTQDIDIVVACDRAQVEPLAALLSSCYLISKESVDDAVLSQGMFQALDLETFIKIDFHVGELVPGELNRSQNVEFLPNLNARLVSKIDAILSKLVWVQQGSGKSWQDLMAMLADPQPIDSEQLCLLAGQLGVESLLNKALGELDSPLS